jgi:hypothetical protein
MGQPIAAPNLSGISTRLLFLWRGLHEFLDIAWSTVLENSET